MDFSLKALDEDWRIFEEEFERRKKTETESSPAVGKICSFKKRSKREIRLDAVREAERRHQARRHPRWNGPINLF